MMLLISISSHCHNIYINIISLLEISRELLLVRESTTWFFYTRSRQYQYSNFTVPDDIMDFKETTHCRESTIRPSQAFSNRQLCKERSSGSVSFWFCPEILIIKIIINNDFELLMRVNLCCEHLELKLWVDWCSCPLVERNLLMMI